MCSRVALDSRNTEEVLLRPFEERDFEALAGIRRDGGLQSLLLSVPSPEGDGAIREWLSRRQSEPGGSFRVIEKKSTGEPLGYVQVSQVHRKNRYGYLGIVICENTRGLGIGHASLRLLLMHAKQDLGLVKLMAEIRKDNTASVRLHLSLGFRIVGTMEKHFIDVHSRRHDVLLVERSLA